MYKKITQIRDLNLIESEVKPILAGVLAINNGSDKIIQVTTPFVYRDKNIYIFFNNEDELFGSIRFDDYVSFTAIKAQESDKNSTGTPNSIYGFISVSITGTIKNVEENKLIEELRQNYLEKYAVSTGNDSDFSVLNKILMIDSEEIQAFEETGG